MEKDKEDLRSFKDLGVCEQLVEACANLGWRSPSKIQALVLPHALEGRDLIGLAQTGSGKTGAFALPILQSLLETPQAFFACVLSPTRELAVQIAEQFKALGSGIGVKCAVLVGGVDQVQQSIALAKRPHIVVATPGRLVDHLSNTKGFTLGTLKYLVLDEADRLLDDEFKLVLDKFFNVIPRERKTYLYSATMTGKVEKLQKACLRKPVKIEGASKYSTVDTLKQLYRFVPSKYKAKRLESLNKFKVGECNILVCTDLASRGLDIPSVDMVINHNIPRNPKDYIHRVGRTARAGRSGLAISLVNQYDLVWYLQIEKLIGKKLPAFEFQEEEVFLLLNRVTEATRISLMKIKEGGGMKRSRRHADDAEEDIQKILMSYYKKGKTFKKARQR